MIKKLRYLFTKKDKQFLILLFFFSIIISIVETAGISVIMPFIAVATDFTLIQTNNYYSKVYNFLRFTSEVDFVIVFGIILIIFYIFRSGLNLFYFYLLSKFTQSRYHLLAYRLFENYMGLPYKEFINRNSSTMTKSIVNEASHLTQLISALLFMMSEIFIVIFIYSMLIFVNWKITLFLTVVLLLNAFIMLKTVSKKIKQAGITSEKVQKIFFEVINKSFRNFKLIKLQSNDKDILKEFGDSSSTYAKANITNRILVEIPRLFLEAVGFSVIISIIIYLLWQDNGDVSSSLALISMFVLALYRLMPSVNRIMTSYNQMLFYYKSLDIIHGDLMYNTEDLGDKKIEFNETITIKDLNFEYDIDKPILTNINLSIKRGSSVAFIGESGSGKSTLVDIIIGLYKPQSGYVISDLDIIDNSNIKSWRSKVGYIPQSVYLFDGTIGENVTFGSEYNEAKVDDVLKKAKIFDFLNTKEGQNTLVGEAGVKLSGGQKQRVAIARALYNNPEILVLDEATSALDSETEKEIMKEIYDISEDKTLIIIAHRLSTLDNCEVIYKLENGKIINTEFNRPCEKNI